MKKEFSKLFLAAVLMTGGGLKLSYAAPTYTSGKIFHFTTTTSGLLIRLEGQIVPDNCAGTPFGYLVIPAAQKHMIASALTTIAMGRLIVTVYTDGLVNGYCQVNQLDTGPL